MSNDQPALDNVYLEDPDLNEVLDNEEPKLWFPSGDLKNLPTKFYSDCTLSRSERQKILHDEPCNAEVDYKPPQIEPYFLFLHPIDNIEKVLFESKPSDGEQEALQGYELLHKSTQNARELLRDALSYANDLRREFALKALSPVHVLTKDRKGVFGDKFKDLVEEENTKSKLYNDANREKRKFYLSNQTNQQSYTYATKRNSWPTSIVKNGYLPEWNQKPPLRFHSIKNNFINNVDIKLAKKEICFFTNTSNTTVSQATLLLHLQCSHSQQEG
ncbi:3075_t:CDS:2 [Cetraspora pellucida]|uniref:3075_t:CDS:1 n=1 Tax=Cetraspora pellucida TaxID=1433469 RepID=A0A9N9IUR2_9GLOM|nr:3075_t:CDS:2 [Cetraspora pellucida]